MRDVFLFLGLASGPVTVLLTTLWILALRRAQRAETMLDRLMLTQQIRGEMKEPRDRVLEALDALSVEVERISEAQRFTARILAERHDPTRPAAMPAKIITPH